MDRAQPTPTLLRYLHRAWVLVGVLVLMLLLAELGLGVFFWARDRLVSDGGGSGPDSTADWRAAADVYADAPWVEDLFREFKASYDTEWHSYVYWRRKPFRGRYINVDEQGLRRTWRPDPPAELPAVPPWRIFVFGGSTIWGTGARDDFTIPSCLARQLHAEGLAVEVTNFGESGYVSSQSVLALLNRLRSGDVPDVVIFYDGVNDVFSAFQSGHAGLPQNEDHRRREFLSLTGRGGTSPSWLEVTADRLLKGTNLGRLVRGLQRSLGPRPDRGGQAPVTASGDPAGAPSQLATRVLDQYAGNLDLVMSLGQRYGFRCLFYWQPVVFTKSQLTPHEEQTVARFADRYPGALPLFAAVYEAVPGRTDLATVSGFHDLSGIFAEDPAPAYIDWSHLGEERNALVARRIVRDLIPLLAQK